MSASSSGITLQDIEPARDRIAAAVVRTPAVPALALGDRLVRLAVTPAQPPGNLARLALQLETRGRDHVAAIIAELRRGGVAVQEED